METSVELEIKKFGAEIRGLRKSKNFTQSQLAAMCDVDIRTIQRIEKGEFNPSLKVLINLAKSFEYTLSELFFKVEKHKY